MNLNILQDLCVNNQSLLKAEMVSISYFGARRMSLVDVSTLMCLLELDLHVDYSKKKWRKPFLWCQK